MRRTARCTPASPPTSPRGSCNTARGASEFCRENGLVRLVTIERHEDIHEAIVREKRMKDWHRQWKLRLIRKANPYWRDLFEDINA